MSPEVWIVIGLAALALSVLALAWAVRQGARKVADEITAGNHHRDRIATAVEGIHHRDQAVQDLEEVSAKQERLLLGIHEVLSAKFTTDEALRPDVITGQDRGVALVKDLLYDKLSAATK